MWLPGGCSKKVRVWDFIVWPLWRSAAERPVFSTIARHGTRWVPEPTPGGNVMPIGGFFCYQPVAFLVHPWGFTSIGRGMCSRGRYRILILLQSPDSDNTPSQNQVGSVLLSESLIYFG